MSGSNTPDHQTPAGSVEPLNHSEATALAEDLIDSVATAVIGHRDTVQHVVETLLAGGHILLADVPGVGKTTLGRALAASVDSDFQRIQFTPDLLPTDVTGVNVFNKKSREFEFQPGPVFANVVLADEINRSPPKTQAALLEAMEEQQVTVDGTDHGVPQPFTVVATQNVIDSEQTYTLPTAELDRFMKQLSLGYPEQGDEAAMVDAMLSTSPEETIDPVTDVVTLNRAQQTVTTITVEEPIRDYAVRLAGYTRSQAAVGVSPRGVLQLLRAAQARALFNGREYVTPDDVKTVAAPTLTHRVVTDDHSQQTAQQLVASALETIAIRA